MISLSDSLKNSDTQKRIEFMPPYAELDQKNESQDLMESTVEFMNEGNRQDAGNESTEKEDKPLTKKKTGSEHRKRVYKYYPELAKETSKHQADDVEPNSATFKSGGGGGSVNDVKLQNTLADLNRSAKFNFDKKRQLSLNRTLKVCQTKERQQQRKSGKICQIGTSGRFILYVTACLYLVGDIRKGMFLTQRDFSHVDNSHLFKGNLKRLEALFYEKHARRSDTVDEEFLLQAVSSTKAALKFFNHEEAAEHDCDRAFRAIAVTHFQLAYM